MEIIVFKNYQELSVFAASLVAEQLKKKKKSVFGLATGETMIGLYEKLAELVKRGELSFAQAATFNLDEFVGLEKTHRGTLLNFMKKNFFSLVDLQPARIFFLDSEAPDPKKECLAYEKSLAKYGPIDLQFLGIGKDGHIGWNEPGTSFVSKTHIAELETVSRKQQAGNFKNLQAVPRSGYTMGIKSILTAKKIVLMASGKDKAEIVERMIMGKVDKAMPASALQKHGNVLVLLDRAAASKLELE